tara:strand:- start:2872 stop:3867 length:996 start_codon:yes stop_codon:yes gene_type:complete
MGAILLRSPRSRTLVTGTTHASAKMTITINGTLAYTIIKPSSAGVYVLFEYAELCRDYVEINWTGSYSGWSPQTNMVILTAISFWTGNNAGGTQVGSTNSSTQYGLDGYSNFVQGANEDIANNATLISNYTQTSGGTKTYTVYTPIGVGGTLPYLNTAGTETLYQSYSTNATSVTLGNSQVINIERYHCNKYDFVTIDFVNKYGAIQREYFTLKNVEKITAKRESYKRNTINSQGGYSVNEHNNQNFNTTAGQEYTVNSDYLPEYYNQVYTELLLSEKVWCYMKSFSTNSFTAVPVNITDSNLIYKTQVNDKLINFTFSFRMSFDYINNIR